MNTERRTHARHAFQGKAYLTYDGRCRCEDVLDVSIEGLFLRTTARIREGKSVKVFLPVPMEEGVRLCLLKGEVVRRAGQGSGAGLGIALIPGEIDTRGLLNRYVEANC
jgi:hypothetical protein